MTPDGEWHEQGEMGWWGLSSETDEEALGWLRGFRGRFLDTADPTGPRRWSTATSSGGAPGDRGPLSPAGAARPRAPRQGDRSP